jgi:ABC-2 type transport system ATP-binding protein
MPTSLAARLRRALPRVRWTRRRAIASAVVVVLVLGLVGWAVAPTPMSYRTSDQMITVQTGPDGTTPVTLDTRLYLPKAANTNKPVPAILLAHGFGGTKDSVASDAKNFADLGYAVLAWTAEGFGRSGGQIHLDSPDWEVKDAQRLIDWLAARPDISKDGPGDPRVAAVGGSYGGGLALMLAGLDKRVDAIVPMITWNDLARSFLPEATGKSPVEGVFKKQWAGIFFGNTLGRDPQCGRFAQDICQAYLSIAATGKANPDAVARLRKSSPASVLGNIKAPTLLIQGEIDSLFPLSEADANARGIAANGTPVRVAWFTGGHDGGTGPQSEVDRLHFLTAQWLDHYLKGNGSAPSDSFTYSRIAGLNAQGRGYVTTGYSVPDYPSEQSTQTVEVQGPPQPIANPPGGNPPAVSTMAGGNSLASVVNGRFSTEVPGQHADFYSEPLDHAVDVVGSPQVQVKTSGDAESPEARRSGPSAGSGAAGAVLFVKLYDVGPDGATLPNGLIAPIRVTGADPVTVTLPPIVYRFQAGHRLRITVATSDQGYATPADPAVYTVSVDPAVTLPSIPGTPIANPNLVWRYVLYGLLVVLAIGLATALVVARRRQRRVVRNVDAAFADTPLVVRELRKQYADGFVAVSKVDFTVRRGQVVGLLGPNGAGKTTTLRVLMGLTRPTAGEVLVFGNPLTPGSPVLSRLGALVEGPGFLPHLSGLQNLQLYWKASGRPEADARLDEAVEIAGLGSAIDRRVKTYSHGMKQRLAIAQAMLGLPELLVLDEPTDGLDPPQIAEMRRVLRRYATDGRAVLVSSHLLAEVEQTCTDVVVMHKGEIVASGPVDDIVGDSPTVQFDVSDVATATAVLGDLASVRSVVPSGNGGLVVDLNGTRRADVVAALVNAGIGVDRVVPRRRLEDAFLALVGGDTKASGER